MHNFCLIVLLVVYQFWYNINTLSNNISVHFTEIFKPCHIFTVINYGKTYM